MPWALSDRVWILTLALNVSVSYEFELCWQPSSTFKHLDWISSAVDAKRRGTFINIYIYFVLIRLPALKSPCAAEHSHSTRGHDCPPAAPGRALAVAAHGSLAAGGAGPAGLGARAAGPASAHQGDAAEERAHGEAHHFGGGVRRRKCRICGGEAHAGEDSLLIKPL